MKTKQADFESILESLRYKVGMTIINPFGEKVVLKELIDGKGCVIGLTEDRMKEVTDE